MSKRKLAGWLLLPIVALGSLSACGSASGTSSSDGVVRYISSSNNNTDPYNGWVKMFEVEYTYDSVFLHCTEQNTGLYRSFSSDTPVQVVPNSPDCPRASQ